MVPFTEASPKTFRRNFSGRVISRAPFAMMILAICLGAQAATAQYVYYNESASGGGYRLHRSALDGSSHQLLLQRTELPVSFAVDPITRRLYWSEGTSIYVANEDGTGIQLFMTATLCGALAIDIHERKLYYTNNDALSQIRRINLNGHNDELVLQLPSNSETFNDIELHKPSGKIYSTIYVSNTFQWRTERANLDGSQRETLTGGLTYQLDVDTLGGTIYWVRAFQNPVGRADLNFQNIQVLATGNDPKDVSADIPGGKVYWVEYIPCRVMRMNLDGSNVEIFRANINLAEDISVLSVSDCNDNGIDDWCDIDCGPAGGYCDVPGCGTLTDINQNHRLDICDECDGNGIPDECDLDCSASGGLCNVPGCGLGDDCNDNDILDECDLLAGTSEDCNENDVPDECDTASATSPDCNLNSVPDECEPLGEDCNENGIRDDCDTLTGPSEDCNLNLIPDECETLNVDCNNNGIRDDCDIATGPSEDCNLNGVPDECDPAGPDCNANGIPDDCDLITGPSNDCDENGVPDECDTGSLAAKVYWGDRIDGKIYRSDVTGGAIEEIIPDAGTPLALAIDPVDRKLYWSNGDTSTLHSANLDGTEAQTLPGSYTSEGLAVDVAGRKLYWTARSGTSNGWVRRSNLDGSQTENLAHSLTRGFHDLALHTLSNSAYFLQLDSDGTPPFEVNHSSTLEPFDHNDLDIFARAIVVDPVRGEIIRAWSGGRIHRSDLLGNPLGSFFVSNDPNEITEDALDGDGRVYWSQGTGLFRAFRTGASIQQIQTGLTSPGPLAVYRKTDCNGNGVDDVCEISCGTPCGPCDVPGCGTAVDCDRDGLLDVCEPPQDCNGNSVDDRCDIASGTSTDCNLSLTPDECDGNDCNGNGRPDTCDLREETSDDCNDNLVPDECDIANSTEEDCNENQVPDTCESECNNNNVPDECDIASGFSQDCDDSGDPDECELAGNDCNSNSIPDSCDIASQTSTDCDENGEPDECELGGRDCNENGIHDTCDILSGFSQDVDQNGHPDECIFVPPLPANADPTGLPKCRFISFAPSSEEATTALRVRMVSLHNVVPPYLGAPTVPFTLFEGREVWVGPPGSYVESTSTGIIFRASRTQCAPHYHDWSTLSLLHVTGVHIVPSSTYHVQHVSTGCQGQEIDCPFVSTPLEIRTTRWGDVTDPYNPPSTTVQPNIADVGALVNKFRSAPGAPIKARAILAGTNAWGEITDPVLSFDVGFSHIAATVDAFRGQGYPYRMGKCASSNAACAANNDCGANGPCNLYCPN